MNVRREGAMSIEVLYCYFVSIECRENQLSKEERDSLKRYTYRITTVTRRGGVMTRQEGGDGWIHSTTRHVRTLDLLWDLLSYCISCTHVMSVGILFAIHGNAQRVRKECIHFGPSIIKIYTRAPDTPTKKNRAKRASSREE